MTRTVVRTALVAMVLAVCGACAEGGSPTAAGSTGAGTIADFNGLYTGTYRVTDCVEDGVFVGFCEGTGLTADTTLPVTLSVNQTQSTITGTVKLGEVTGTFQGTASGSTLTGTAVMGDLTNEGVTLTTAISSWNTTISGDALSGGFTVVMRADTYPGSATFRATLLALTR